MAGSASTVAHTGTPVAAPPVATGLDGGNIFLVTLKGKDWVVAYASSAHYAVQEANY